jgi:hypothetical protein
MWWCPVVSPRAPTRPFPTVCGRKRPREHPSQQKAHSAALPSRQKAHPEASKLPWADVKRLYDEGRIKVFLSELKAFRGLAEATEGSWQKAVRALGVPQSRLLWKVDYNGHGTQLEFDTAGGYAAVVVWL